MQIVDNDIRIIIGSQALGSLDKIINEEYSSVKKFILVDENTLQHCYSKLITNVPSLKNAELIEIESGEAAKCMELVTQLCQTLIELEADRKSLLINLGGGVITDLGGFIASIYKRGIDFINIPTTLLAQVDASVGGKVGVDLGELKNQIGVFNHASCVVVEPEFLLTLDERQLIAGYAEMLKHALIADCDHWNRLQKINFTDTKLMSALLYESIMIKYNIVVSDFKETGDRKKLNFGHTIGHAIESLLMQKGMPILHGEAVAIGIICESYISHIENGMTDEMLTKIVDEIAKKFEYVSLNSNEFHQLIELMKTDKKNENNFINFSLLKTIGESSINHTPKLSLILESLEFYNKQYK